jgi:hypothetical protein
MSERRLRPATAGLFLGSDHSKDFDHRFDHRLLDNVIVPTSCSYDSNKACLHTNIFYLIITQNVDQS